MPKGLKPVRVRLALAAVLVLAPTDAAVAEGGDVSIDYQPFAGGVAVWCSNRLPGPVTVDIAYDLQNMVARRALPRMVVPAGGRQQVGTLVVAGPGAWHYNWTYHYQLGDFRARPAAVVYKLPFPHGTACPCAQGYNGSFSHQGENALDFLMPEGSTVVAARAGTVVQVVDHFSAGGLDPAFKPQANFIQVAQADGTCAFYGHLQQGGALVAVGQQVRAGQPIARSGNTGFSSRPHLHFEVRAPIDGYNLRTFPTTFATTTAPAGTSIHEGQTYTAP